MDVAMLVLTVLLALAVKVSVCHPTATQPTATHSPELNFNFLQIDASEEMTYHPNGSQRPSPSDHLPIDDLLENKSEIYDPRPNDINVKLLRHQLGDFFDKEYMSIKDPRTKPDKKTFIEFINDRPKGPRPTFLGLLRTAYLQDGRKIKLNVNKKDRKKFQKFIWSLTFCPVQYSWKFLGIRFWPQWIREGTCSNKRSCSIPEGMMCKPTTSTNKIFLRWHCGDFTERSSCKWIPIQYPIITECACAC